MLLLALVAAASGFQSIRSVQSPRSFRLRSQPKPQKDEIQAELRRLAEEMAQPADDEALAPPPVDLAFAPFFMRALLPLAYRGLAAAALATAFRLPRAEGAAQVARLETEIDDMNADLQPLRSFILPGGSALAAHLHLSRTVARRAEGCATALAATVCIENPRTP